MLTLKTLGFHHVAIQVRDVERVAAFYRDVLGLKELARHQRDDGALHSIWVQVGFMPAAGFFAIELAGLNSTSALSPLGFSMIALRIDAADRASLATRLAEQGVTIEKQSVWTLYVRDPENNLVGLSHHPHPAPSEGG